MPEANNTPQPMNDQFQALKEKARAYAKHILALSNDSFEKTVAVAVSMCLIGAVLVSGSAVALKPLQEANKSRDEKVNILEVAGLLESADRVDDAFKAIETRIVDLNTGEYAQNIDAATFEQWKAAKDPSLSDPIPAEKDVASIKRRPRYSKVYLVKEDGKISSVILPVSGYGLWSTMYGFIAVQADGETVLGLNLYDQAETPGLGGEVVNPIWKALWKGKKIYNFSNKVLHESTLTEKGESIEIGEVALGLVKGTVDSSKSGAEYQVDGLAGATLTSRGVSNLVRYWMGPEGYAIYLAKIRTGRG